jgi:ubiquinone/menaquinone biosynthesis C-methylase UbiE
MLEIGIGSGVLGAILKKIDCPYKSMDIDPELTPDYVGSILKIPFSNDSFDVVGCFQVLEHLPFGQFHHALNELLRVACKAVIISLPDDGKLWSYSLYIPKLGTKRVQFPRPFTKTVAHTFDGEHYWEINKKGYEIKRIKEIIENISQGHHFMLERNYRVWENTYHHFFVIKKIV